jgi:signal transduction histidine kinase
MAMQVGRFAAWEWDVATERMTWSSDPEVLFGFPKGAFGSELRITRALHPDDRSAVDEAIASAHRSGTYEAEYRLVRPNGQIVWVRERGRVVNSPGRSRRLIGVSHDRTGEHEAAVERERLLQSARQARDEAERQGRLKDEFLATLSHELRTPMNAMLGWLSILDAGKPIRDVYSALSVIRRNAEIQAKLIDDLLDMNRLLSGTACLEVAPIDLGVLAQGALQALQPAADAKGVQLMCVVDSSMGAVLADARRLQQVLWNLVHNAIKFTPSGGRVEIHVRRSDGNLQIIVQDTGQGISRDFLPHVFERFRQEDASHTRGKFGLGLGLSIAKHLVELHGGAITAFSSGTGRGARFEVEIPAVPGSGSQVNRESARSAEAI